MGLSSYWCSLYISYIIFQEAVQSKTPSFGTIGVCGKNNGEYVLAAIKNVQHASPGKMENLGPQFCDI